MGRIVCLGLLAGLIAASACSRSGGAARASDSAVTSDGARESAPASPFEVFSAMPPTVGERAPAFSLQGLDGGRVDLAEAVARGPVVLVFGSFS